MWLSASLRGAFLLRRTCSTAQSGTPLASHKAHKKKKERGHIVFYSVLLRQLLRCSFVVRQVRLSPLLGASLNNTHKSKKEQAKENKANEKRIKALEKEEKDKIKKLEKAEAKAEKAAAKAAKKQKSN